MINIINSNDLDDYKKLDKIYIPQNYNNSNYTYILNDDFITIKTNLSCRTQYSSTYCTCYQYNYTNNIITSPYECSINNSTQIIPYSSITSDINYSSHIKSQYYSDTLIFLIMLILGLLFALFLTKERSSY